MRYNRSKERDFVANFRGKYANHMDSILQKKKKAVVEKEKSFFKGEVYCRNVE